MILRSYHDTNGYYPTDQGLNALVRCFMGEVPKDAWGLPYVYRCPGMRNANSYDLFAAGPTAYRGIRPTLPGGNEIKADCGAGHRH